MSCFYLPISKLFAVNIDEPDITPSPSPLPDSSPVVLIGVAVGAGITGGTLALLGMWFITRRRS